MSPHTSYMMLCVRIWSAVKSCETAHLRIARARETLRSATIITTPPSPYRCERLDAAHLYMVETGRAMTGAYQAMAAQGVTSVDWVPSDYPSGPTHPSLSQVADGLTTAARVLRNVIEITETTDHVDLAAAVQTHLKAAARCVRDALSVIPKPRASKGLLTPGEFHALVPGLVLGFATRVPQEWRHGFGEELDSGEKGMAVDKLVHMIRHYRIPVTRTERRQLFKTLAYLNRDVSIIDTLTVVPDHEGAAT